MNLTERLLEARIRRVWRRSIQPAAAKLRDRGVDVFDAPSDDDVSWYTTVEPDAPHFVDVVDVEHALADMWERQGLPELAVASSDIAKLVETLRTDSPQQREVSSDVYAMY